MNEQNHTERDVLVRLTTIMRSDSFPTMTRVRAAAVLGLADDKSSTAVRDALATAVRNAPSAPIEVVTDLILDELEPEHPDEDDER